MAMDVLGLACGAECAPLSWNFITLQLAAGVAIWTMMLLLGLGLRLSGGCNSEGCKERVGDAVDSLAASKPFLWARMLAAVTQCVLFCIRAQSRAVRDVELAVEGAACAVHAIRFVPKWASKFLASAGKGTSFMFTGALDCFLIPSVLCMALIPVNGRKSWGSLSFLAVLHLKDAWSLRMEQKHQQRSGSDVLISSLSVAYFGTTSVLMLERLGDPAILSCCNKDRWNVVSALYFTVSTVATVGAGDFAPATSIGRMWTGVTVFGGLTLVALGFNRVQTVMQSAIMGFGSYRPRWKRRHVIVTGSPGTQEALDFVAEIYHEDHCPESDDLDVVFLLPRVRSASDAGHDTLKALSEHRNALPARLKSRLYILQGSVMDEADMERVHATSACAFFVFPPPLSEDPDTEDTENVVRANAIRLAAPDARVILVLNKAQHQASLLEGSAAAIAAAQGSEPTFSTQLSVIAVDEFKLGLVAKQAQIPGFIPLITNLCKCIGGDVEFQESSWQAEYERGLQKELYEVELSPAYADQNAVFAEVVLDVLDRSDGDVYLIGLVEGSYGTNHLGTRKILFNPEPGYNIQPSTVGATMGIFVAPNADAIVQMQEESTGLFRMGSVVGRSVSSYVRSRRVSAQRSLFFAHKESEDGLGGGQPSGSRWPFARLRQSFRQSSKQQHVPEQHGADDGDEDDLTHAHGLSVRSRISTASLLSRGVPHNTDPFFIAHPEDDEEEKVREEIKLSTSDWAGEIDPMLLTFLKPHQKDAVLDLVGFARRHSHANLPQAPPLEVLAKGGHVLYLCTGAEGLGSLRLGADHFVRPLRRHMRRSAEPIPIVIVAPVQPSDWHLVNSFPHVYFLQGSPSSQFDLDRANVKGARHIFVTLAGDVVAGSKSVASWAVDSEVICVSRLLDAQLDPDNDVTVVTDVHSDKSHHFMKTNQESSRGRRRRSSQLERATKMSDGLQLFKEGDVMDDYYRSELFVSGRMFVGTAITSLAVNTFYNPSLHHLLMTMVKAKVSAVKVPRNWIDRSYRDLFDRLLWGEQLLPMALFRRGEPPAPSYVQAAPPATECQLKPTDLIICFGQKSENI